MGVPDGEGYRGKSRHYCLVFARWCCRALERVQENVNALPPIAGIRRAIVGLGPNLTEAPQLGSQKQRSSASTCARFKSSTFARSIGMLRNMDAFLPPRWRMRMTVSASSY